MRRMDGRSLQAGHEGGALAARLPAPTPGARGDRGDTDLYQVLVLRAIGPGRYPEGVSLSRWHREEAHPLSGYLGCSNSTKGTRLSCYPVGLDRGRDADVGGVALC